MRRSFCILTVVLLSVSGGSSAEDAPLGRWERLPLTVGGDDRVGTMGVDPGGTIWIAHNGGVYYWNGDAFFQPPGDALVSDDVLSAIFGGPDRGLYLTQPGNKLHTGKLYKLSPGQSEFVADFEQDEQGSPPKIYVSKSGQVFNWGLKYLAVLKDGQWLRTETRLPPRPVILDAGATVYFYYAGKVRAVDAEGKFSERSIPREDAPIDLDQPPEQLGAVLSDDKMVLFTLYSRGVAVYTLPDCRRIWADALRPWRQTTMQDIFRAGDGSVWMLEGPLQAREGRLLRILPTGEVQVVARSEDIHWTRSRAWQKPAATAASGDGALWLGPERGGVVRVKNGETTPFGWENGLAIEAADRIFELPGGKIAAASARSVWLYDPKRPPVRATAEGPWREFAGVGPMRDSAGNAWMFHRDRPGRISRREGEGWVEVAVPISGDKLEGWMADDRGHLLLWERTDRRRCVDVGPEGAKDFGADETKMVAAALARGAKRFEPGTGMAGCIVLDDGRAAFAHAGEGTAFSFDGKDWSELDADDGMDAVFEDSRHGIVFRTQDGRLWRRDGRELADITPKRKPDGRPEEEIVRWLVGPAGSQAFDEELIRRHPDAYVPVENCNDGWHVLWKPPGQNAAWARGEVVRNRLDRVLRATTGGMWGRRGWTACRIIGGRSFPVETAGTPLAGRALWFVFDDREGNLWFESGMPEGPRSVFFRRSAGFRIRVLPVPPEVGVGFGVQAESETAGIDTASIRLAYRLPGGDWKGGDPGGSVLVEFPADGEYDVEFLAVDLLGAVSKPATVHMRSKFAK